MSIFLSALAFAILTLAFPLPLASVLTAAYVSILQFPLPLQLLLTVPLEMKIAGEFFPSSLLLLPSTVV